MRGHIEISFSCWASAFISAAVFLSTICNFLVPNNASALYSASISTSSSVTLDVSPAGDGVGVRGESVDVTTNCSAGYNLSVSTSGNNTLYLNGSTGANAISPMSSTYALNNTNNTNTWGLSLSNNPLTAGAFNPLSTTPLTLKTASETATEGNIDDSFNIYYGTKVSNSIPTGLYSMANNGSIVFYLTMDTSCTDSLDITFLPNAGNDTVTNLPTSSDNTFDTTNHTLILSNKVPVRNGYIFKEWNTASNGTGDYYAPGAVIPTGQNGLSGFIDFYAIWVENCVTATICYDGNHADAGTMSNQSATNGSDVNLIPSNFSRAGYGFAGWNTKADGTGTNYGPGQTITMPASGGLNLFANWIAPSGTLQTWSGASSMNTGDVIALRDNRDNEVYAVAKLADNNVWIVENFRLVPNTANITDKNTHNPTSAFLSAYSSSSSSVSQCSTDNAACVEQVLFNSNNLNRSLTPAYNVNDNETAWYSYGVMYNWYTATAGNGSSSLASGSVAGDLCPSGWHLPSGGASGEWGVLASAMSGSTAADKAKTLRNYPNNFIYSGDFNPSKGTPDGRGVQGRIWSTTAASGKNAYRMGYDVNRITGTTNSWNKWDNFSIRCIYQGGNTPYVDVTVDFEGSGINSVSFSGQNLTTETATPNNPTVSIVKDANYTITANAAAGYRATSWSTTSAGTLGNSYSDPNTYTVTDDATLTVTGGAMTAHAVTVNLGANVRSVSFSHANYPTQTVVNSNVGTNNNNGEYTGTVNLYQDLEYTLSSSYEDGYGINAWVTSSNGTLGSTILSSTTYSVVGTATLSLTAKEVEELTYVLVYSAGSGTDAPNGETTTSLDPIHSFSITNSTPIYYGYTFTGWSETSDGNGNGTTVDFTSGDTITITTTGTSTTKTLYPVYAANAACPSGKICYYENGADVQNGGRGTMANQTASSNSTAKLIPTNYSRTGYGFAGWTTSANATPYGPNATIATPDLSSTGLSLYAKWVASSGTFQSWTGCNAMTTNSVIALTDTRDGNTYAVAKLADGNCWTIENLRLVPSAATITSENTHNPASGFATEAASSSSSNALCNTDDDSSCINQLQYNTNSLDRSLTQSYDTVGNNVAWYSYGVYYNWYTATAGNGVYNTSANANVTGDICPKNWHLPTSTSSGEWAALNTAVNGGVSNADAGLRNYPINLVWSGDYNGSSRTSGYSNGRYWSSTGFDANNAYRMGHQESGSKGSTPSGNYRKWDGFAIRCIRDENIEYVNITVNLDAHTSSVGFYSATYGTEQAVNNNGNNNGTDTVTVSLVKSTPYTITASFTSGYGLASWSNGTNSTIGSTITNPTTYTVTNTSTLNVTSREQSVGLDPSDCPAGYVCYAPNASDIEGSMSSLGSIASSPAAGRISVGTSATEINLIAPNYKREGYGFAGWSTDFTATNASTIYGPNETLTVPSTTLATKGMILYPVWVASSGTLQGWMGCSSLTPATYDSTTGKISATLSSITALTDARDGNTYAVAKLADGQCWMIENLRLNSEHTTSSGDIALAEGYGNATTSINAGGNNLGRFIGLPASEDANFGDNTTANSLYSIDGTNGTININSNSSYYPGYRLPRYNKNNTNMAPNATNSDGATSLVTSYNANDNHSRWYGYGNYYNWPAAMANTEYYTTYSGNNGSDAAGTSICPSNWHLPLGYTSTGELDNQEASSTWRVGGFSYLDRKMGGTGTNSSANSVTGASMSSLWRSFPNNFVYSGFWNGAQAYNRSSYGSYWSSSADNSYYAYYLGLNSSSVRPGANSSGKYYGFTVRCVAQPSTYTITVSLDSHTTGVSFYNADYGTQSVSTNGGTVTLREGVAYTITASFDTDYELASWSTGTNSTIGSTTTNPTTYTATNTSTLSVTSQEYVVAPLVSSDCPANSICYAPNANNIIGNMSSLGMMSVSPIAGVQTTTSGVSGATSITASTTKIELIAPNYIRSGYGFAGWSTDYTANSSSAIYGPNETITITAGSLSPNGMILYPVWIASAGDMQEWNGCSGLTAASYNSSTGIISAALSSLTALTDTRDGNVYTIAKLADGKCWMVENLRLNAENTRGAENIAKAQGYGQSATYGNFIGLANSENDHFDQGSSPNEYYSLDGDTIVNVGVYDDGQHRIPRYNNNNTNNNLAASYNSSGGDTYYSWQNYGNYYNWPAAIASTKYYNTYSGVDGSDNAGTSLCPKGWQLPLGGPSTGTLGQGANNSANRVGGFSYLDRKMGGTGTDGSTNSATGTSNVYNWRTFPNNFIYSGGFSNSYSVLRGTRGYYLTRSAKSDNIRLSYALYMDEDELRPGTSDSEKNISGQTIRCISQ